MKNILVIFSVLLFLIFISGCEEQSEMKDTSGKLDRTILPIKAPIAPTYSELDVRNATPPPRFEVKAPEGAPNVLLVLIDDLGFAGTE
ncbi:MAG: hypothetical protein U5J96_08050 [Ignavibacteriaceae bacterium]|nr:hypothetical protein [Ignavibacteriaceae bacterium]